MQVGRRAVRRTEASAGWGGDREEGEGGREGGKECPVGEAGRREPRHWGVLSFPAHRLSDLRIGNSLQVRSQPSDTHARGQGWAQSGCVDSPFLIPPGLLPSPL